MAVFFALTAQSIPTTRHGERSTLFRYTIPGYVMRATGCVSLSAPASLTECRADRVRRLRIDGPETSCETFGGTPVARRCSRIKSQELLRP